MDKESFRSLGMGKKWTRNPPGMVGECKVLGEDRMEIVGVNGGIIVSPLFRVDVPSSSQGIWFRAKVPGMEIDDEIKS